jgi:hypothetical protein
MTVHIGWVIAAALAGVVFGVLLMSLMAVASAADELMERSNRGGIDVTNPPRDFTAISKE